MRYKFKRHGTLVMEFDLSDPNDLGLACLCFKPITRVFPSQDARNALYTFRCDYNAMANPSNVVEFPKYIACSVCNTPIQITKGEHTVCDGYYYHNECIKKKPTV